MALLDVQFAAPDLSAAQDRLNPRQLRQAMYQAVVRTLRKLGVAVQKEFVKRSGLSTRYVKIAQAGKRAGNAPIQVIAPGSAKEHAGGLVKVRSVPIPAIAWPSRQSGKGVRVSLPKQSILFRHAFKATMKTGHKGIFMRSRRATRPARQTKRGYAARLAIEEVFGPPITQVIGVPDAINSILFDAQEELRKQLQSQIDRFTKPKK